jgi:hypothetical protein
MIPIIDIVIDQGMDHAEGEDDRDYEDLPEDLTNRDPLVYALCDVAGSQYLSFSRMYGFCSKMCRWQTHKDN